MNNLEKLVQVFTDTLEIKAESITDTFSYGDARWDSVAHMAIIAGIETVFDIMMDTDDVIDMSSFAKAKEILGKYGIDIKS